MPTRFPFLLQRRSVCSFPETLSSSPAGKAVLTGSPIRQELLSGDKYRAREFLHFTSDKPVILVVGGSPRCRCREQCHPCDSPGTSEKLQVIHLCGRGKLDPSLNGTEGYAQFEYIKEELRDLFALTDIVISRAGANAICELLALPNQIF
ncbi:MAG: glycosyltransferase [Dorea sp.]